MKEGYMSGYSTHAAHEIFTNSLKIRYLGTNGIPEHATALYIQDNRKWIGSFQS